MPRLFVAIDLPDAVTAELARLRPPAMPGVRSVEPGQMHLTLHFLGEADAGRVAEALRAVAERAFSIDIAGVGQFSSASGAVTMWAGVRESQELLGLHAAVADALAVVGFRPEARRYTPHVTLARCEAGAPADVVDSFLGRHGGFSLPDLQVTAFGLYSSEFAEGAPVYRCERSFPLSADG